MFEENEDVILPDDFQEEATPPEVEEEVTEVEDTKPTEEPVETKEEPPTEPQKVKIKYNHEEQEITLDEAIVLAQKGKNYDKLQDKLNQLESNPSLSFVEAQAKKHNMTTEQYIDAVKHQEEQDRLNELLAENIPEEYAKEMLENQKFREQYQTEKQQQQEAEQSQQQMNEFIAAYPDVKGEDIKPETWQKVDQGVPLKYAYMEQERQDLLNKVKVVEQNKKNQDRAPVKGVAEHGSVETTESDPFLDGFNSID